MMKTQYANVKARQSALEKTAVACHHLMMSSVLKLAKSSLMATPKVPA